MIWIFIDHIFPESSEFVEVPQVPSNSLQSPKAPSNQICILITFQTSYRPLNDLVTSKAICNFASYPDRLFKEIAYNAPHSLNAISFPVPEIEFEYINGYLTRIGQPVDITNYAHIRLVIYGNNDQSKSADLLIQIDGEPSHSTESTDLAESDEGKEIINLLGKFKDIRFTRVSANQFKELNDGLLKM